MAKGMIAKKIEGALQKLLEKGCISPTIVVMSQRTAWLLDSEFKSVAQVYEVPNIMIVDGKMVSLPREPSLETAWRRITTLMTQYGELRVVTGDVPDGTILLAWGDNG